MAGPLRALGPVQGIRFNLTHVTVVWEHAPRALWNAPSRSTVRTLTRRRKSGTVWYAPGFSAGRAKLRPEAGAD